MPVREKPVSWDYHYSEARSECTGGMLYFFFYSLPMYSLTLCRRFDVKTLSYSKRILNPVSLLCHLSHTCSVNSTHAFAWINIIWCLPSTIMCSEAREFTGLPEIFVYNKFSNIKLCTVKTLLYLWIQI